MANGTGIPNTGKPPVIFLNGYQFGCTEKPTFAGTFGIADQVLQQDGRVTLFFDNCEIAGNPPIEDLGNAFRDYLNNLKYADGQPVAQVDVVAHSLGGMIVRSYLSGKQKERGVFQPPAEVKIRKAVFLSVPFFGAVITDFIGNLPGFTLDTQGAQLQPGNVFSYDLATWNQGVDDLRGIDAVAAVATGGTAGLPPVVNLRARFTDSTVSISSGSLDFIYPNRTRVLPGLCHTVLTGLLSVGCATPTSSIARITGADHDTAKIVLSFLNGTTAWRSVGVSPADNEFLKDYGGIALQIRDKNDQVVRVESATPDVRVRNNEIVHSDYIAKNPAFVTTATISGGTVQSTFEVPAGGIRPWAITTGGPVISAIIPNFSDVFPRAVAPGSFISIYGNSFATAATQASATPYPATLGGVQVRLNDTPIGLQYVSATQINAVVPDDASGLMKLTVRTADGQRTLNLMVEAAVPSLYPTAVNAVTGALITAAGPARAGDVLSIYLTGLGVAERRADNLPWAKLQPSVTIGGQPCVLTYAGRSSFVGLDQINCVVPGLTASDSTQVVVTQGSRIATMSVPVR